MLMLHYDDEKSAFEEVEYTLENDKEIEGVNLKKMKYLEYENFNIPFPGMFHIKNKHFQNFGLRLVYDILKDVLSSKNYVIYEKKTKTKNIYNEELHLTYNIYNSMLEKVLYQVVVLKEYELLGKIYPVNQVSTFFQVDVKDKKRILELKKMEIIEMKFKEPANMYHVGALNKESRFLLTSKNIQEAESKKEKGAYVFLDEKNGPSILFKSPADKELLGKAYEFYKALKYPGTWKEFADKHNLEISEIHFSILGRDSNE